VITKCGFRELSDVTTFEFRISTDILFYRFDDIGWDIGSYIIFAELVRRILFTLDGNLLGFWISTIL